jgi:hypothetical protein
MGVLEAGALVIGVALALRTGELSQQLLEAARRGDTRNVERLLSRGAVVDARSAYGRTALDVAAGKGNLDVVKLLIKHKANVNARDSFYHATPLTWAAMSHRKEVVKALLEAGASGGESLLLDAVRERDADLARLVLERAKPKQDMLDAALAVAPADAPAIIEALKKAGAKPAAPSYQLDAATLQSYAGSYEGQGTEVSLVPDKDRLLVKFGGQTFYTLTPVSKTKFKAIGQAGVTAAIDMKADRVDGFSIKTTGDTIKFTRSTSRKAEIPKPAPADEAPVHITTPVNWPSFRGPDASGVADGQMPPTNWDVEKGTNVLWKTPIPGLGHSCPVVWGDRVSSPLLSAETPTPSFGPANTATLIRSTTILFILGASTASISGPDKCAGNARPTRGSPRSSDTLREAMPIQPRLPTANI